MNKKDFEIYMFFLKYYINSRITIKSIPNNLLKEIKNE